MKTKIEQKLMKCKKCKKKTIHVRNVKKWGIGSFLYFTNMTVLTCGLYLLYLGLKGGNKEKWLCEKCSAA